MADRPGDGRPRFERRESAAAAPRPGLGKQARRVGV